jgi:hypothetical protein
MVACVVKIVLGPDTGWEVQRIANIMTSLLKTYESAGFRSVQYLFNYETGEYQGTACWDATKEFVESILPAFIPLLRKMIQHHCQWEPSVELFDVYVPKSFDLEFHNAM